MFREPDKMTLNKNICVLVTGATGFVGSRLVPRLLKDEYSVRVLVRDPQRLQGRSWFSEIEVFAGDVLLSDTHSLSLEGTDAAYYLIHSMSSAGDFSTHDLDAAEISSKAAKDAKVKWAF